MASQLEYKVDMTCGGCAKAITALSTKVDGVASVDADWKKKTVVVKGNMLDTDAVTAAIGKAGKTILEQP